MGVRASTGEGNGNPLQCSCLENPRDGGSWWAVVYGVAQSRTRLKWLSSRSSRASTYEFFSPKENSPNWASSMAQRDIQETENMQFWSLGREDPLEEMATHSSILAWKIPWTEEAGGLQSTGSWGVRQNWATEHKVVSHAWGLNSAVWVCLGCL